MPTDLREQRDRLLKQRKDPSVSRAQRERLLGKQTDRAGLKAQRERLLHGAPQDTGGDGVLGTIAHVVDQLPRDLADAAIHAPAGIYEIGKAIVGDVREGNLDRTGAIGKAMAQATWEDLQHPLRHPGYTLLDALMIGSAGAGVAGRVGTAARTGRAGALVKRAPFEERIVDVGGVPTTLGTYSRSYGTRYAQKGLDVVREAHPNAPILGRSLINKAGFQEARRAHIADAIERTPALALLLKNKKLSLAENTALRVVAEGATIDKRIATHTADLAAATSASERLLLRRKIKLARMARKYVDESSGKPVLTDAKLIETYESLKASAKHREDLFDTFDVLTPEIMRERLQKPGRVYEGAKYERTLDAIPDEKIREGMRVRPLDRENIGTIMTADRAAKTADVFFHNKATGGKATITFPFSELAAEGKGRFVGAEDFAAGETYIGTGSSARVLGPVRVGASRVVGNPRRPGSLKKMTGGAIHRGTFADEAARVVAEADIEAVRYTTLLRNIERLQPYTKEIPSDLKYDIPIRLEELRGKNTPPELRAIMNRVVDGEKLTATESAGLGMVFQAVRERVFPDRNAALLEFAQGTGPIKGVRWIDDRLLHGLNKPRPLVGFGSSLTGKRTLALVDAINNASKLMILYLKPAYAIPNLLGNAAFNLIQQGFATPKYLARSLRVYHRLSDEALAAGEAVMGEGLSRALAASHGPLQTAVNFGAGKWSAIVDNRFRWSSFLYEANRAGFKDWRSVERLLTDPAKREKLTTVAMEANSEIVDYARLGPFEQDVIRRVVFFYPWVKGSTVYAGRFLGEHPGQAYLAEQTGQIGQAAVDEQLGPLPSWAQGMFQVGERDGNPLVVNPAAATILGTPATVLKTLTGLGQGNVGSAYGGQAALSPAAAALLTLVAGVNDFGQPIRPGQSRIGSAAESLVGVPQKTLYDRLTKDQSGKTFPMSDRDALIQFLVGGIAPRPANRRKLKQAYEREQAGR